MTTSGTVEQTFIGYTNWNDASRGLPKHKQSNCHRESVDRIYFKSSNINNDELLVKQSVQEKAKNRSALLNIISTRYDYNLTIMNSPKLATDNRFKKWIKSYLWNRTMLNFCGIVVAIFKMEIGRNFSISEINSGRWNRTMLNLCGIVVAILKMATGRNFSISGIISGHHNLPTYEMSLKSDNVEFVRYCGGHFEYGDR